LRSDFSIEFVTFALSYAEHDRIFESAFFSNYGRKASLRSI